MNKFAYLLASILLIFAMSCSQAQLPESSIVVENPNVVDSIYQIGDYQIGFSTDPIQLTVINMPLARELWSTRENEAFVIGAIGEAEFEEERGSFTINETIDDISTEQSIANISYSSEELTITGTLTASNHSTDYTIVFNDNNLSDGISINVTLSDDQFNRIYLDYKSQQSEQYFGFGEQFTHFNHKGNRVPVLVQEQGIGRGDIDNPLINLVLGSAVGNEYTTYVAVPQYISSDLRGGYLKNGAYSEFDFTEDDRVQIKLFENHLQAVFHIGDTPQKLIEQYTAYCGRMKELPDWIHQGAILGMQGGTEKVYRIWNDLKRFETPLAGFWIQDWEGQRISGVGKQLWWNWELDENRYPDYDLLLDSLNKEEVQLLGYINPFLVEVEGEKSSFKRSLFQEAVEASFLVEDEQGDPVLIENTTFSSGIVDITNPDAQVWIKDVIKDELIARGFKGWMADFGEALPYDVELDLGRTDTFHNRYPQVWQRLNKEAIAESGLTDEIVYFCRSGYTKSPGKTTLFWLGDQMVTWRVNDGIKSAVTGLVSGGMSGFSLNHSDIGGYTSINYPVVERYIRKRELLERWTQMNAFSVCFRTHEGLGPDNNQQVYRDDEALAHFSKWAKVFKALSFYRKELVAEASLNGMPVVRHPFLHFPNDAEVYNINYQQFMLGDQFMIAPILDQGKTETEIYLPEGNWVNFWTDELIVSTGSYYVVTDLADHPAVFCPQNSAIAAQFKANLSDLGILE